MALSFTNLCLKSDGDGLYKYRLSLRLIPSGQNHPGVRQNLRLTQVLLDMNRQAAAAYAAFETGRVRGVTKAVEKFRNLGRDLIDLKALAQIESEVRGSQHDEKFSKFQGLVSVLMTALTADRDGLNSYRDFLKVNEANAADAKAWKNLLDDTDKRISVNSRGISMLSALIKGDAERLDELIAKAVIDARGHA
ncbi:MAG: hypothetical protein IJ164_00215 [Duodenibacillus sp.]|nr:hypothetical protein [Duodenibacillus sp.]